MMQFLGVKLVKSVKYLEGFLILSSLPMRHCQPAFKATIKKYAFKPYRTMNKAPGGGWLDGTLQVFPLVFVSTTLEDK